ncbi:MAG: methyltransferase domain-containing protein [Pseudomonadota bacterium]|nr:methyltransferase domain-containing protein [Pseudomonadota bacterium]
MPDFRQRSGQAELMDEANLSFAEFDHCLRELETINVLTLAYRPTLQWLEGWLARREPLRILDAGSGGGDMLRRVLAMTRRLRAGDTSSVELTGVDLNPWAKQSAELHAQSPIRHVTGSIFDFAAEPAPDLIICSLFTHHLDDAQVVNFLRWIDARAQRGWFINDLHRHALPYYFIKYATRLCSRNRLIRHDAAVSVARAFTAADWRRLLERAGIAHARLQWHFPFRLCVSCNKT